MSARESAAFVANVALPTWAKGIIIRRKPVVALAERLDFDRRAVRQMQRLRDAHGSGPLLVRNPIRPQAVLFGEADVRRVLENAPEPFSPASAEKRAALSHFQPHNSLISRGPERPRRRAFQEDVLDSACPVHRMGGRLVAVAEEEAAVLLRTAAPAGILDWDLFFESWFRVVRRVVLGRAARDDHELTDMVAKLRGRANWAFAAPVDRRLRDAFHRRLAHHLERAEEGSLAAAIARSPDRDAEPTHQVAQWLFAFDPGGMATWRTLALLAAHPRELDKARTEVASGADRTRLNFLRAALVETLRLYPTTPMILRQTTEATEWGGRTLPAGAGVLIFTPFFHRDDARLPHADRFEPEYWLGRDPGDAIPLVPFSAGPAVCPARHLVPMLGSAFLARLLEGERRVVPADPARLDPLEPLPGTLDPYTIRFHLPAGV